MNAVKHIEAVLIGTEDACGNFHLTEEPHMKRLPEERTDCSGMYVIYSGRLKDNRRIEVVLPDEQLKDWNRDFPFDPQTDMWTKDCLYENVSCLEVQQARYMIDMITESLHEGLDGWTEAQQETIMDYLKDILTAMKRERESAR